MSIETNITKYEKIIEELNKEIKIQKKREDDLAQSGAWGYSVDSMYSSKALLEKRQIYTKFLDDLKNIN